jgi:catecholate siderophore receptor
MGKSSRRHYQKVTTVALAIALPGLTLAAEENTLPTIQVDATSDSRYSAPALQSAKYTAPLRDTPQTVTVVKKEIIEEQGLLSLRDVLSTIPGITFAAGEGGANFGDAINIRGFSGSDNITVDSLKDANNYSRSDAFNLEQVEVFKGSNSAFTGSGAVGGSINLVNKTPKVQNFTEISAGVGTDDYYRATLDANQLLSDDVAARVNVMLHRNDVPNRDFEQYERWGIAPSITFGVGTVTNATFSYIHQEDQGFQRYGVPYFNGKPLPNVDRSNYYGFSNLDKQDVITDAFTVQLNHEINEYATLRNTTRLSRVDIEQVAAPPRDNWCLADGRKPVNWSQTFDGTNLSSNTTGFIACPAASATNPAPGFFQMSDNRPGSARNSVNTMIASDSSILWKFNTLGIEHDLVTGVMISKERYERDAGRMVFNADGTLPASPIARPINIYNPDNHFYGPINYFSTSNVHGSLETRAAYFFDTIKFNEMFQLVAGLRYDRAEGTFRDDRIDPATKEVTAGELFKSNDDLVSYKVGGVFKPVENASIYLSYADSQTPSQTSVSGGCNARNCNLDPEKAETYEAGIKWDLFDNKLSTTASLFRTNRTNYKVGISDESNAPLVLDGSSRVEGIELGLSGLILPNWSIFANATLQDSEVLQGTSDQRVADGKDWMKGDPVLFVPKVAASLWTTYEFFNLPFYGRSVQVGYGLTYQGKTTLNNHIGIENANNSGEFVRSTLPLVESDDYMVHNFMVRYMMNRNATVQLNLRNAFDEEYYTNIRNHATNGTSGSWAYPGEGSSAILNLTYKF